MSEDALAKIMQMLGDIKQELGMQSQRLVHIEVAAEEGAKWREDFDTVFAKHSHAEEKMFAAHTSRMESIEQAFLADAHGRPDFSGHNSDHKERRDTGDTWNRRKDKVVETILNGTAWAVVVGVAWALWELAKVQMRGG